MKGSSRYGFDVNLLRGSMLPLPIMPNRDPDAPTPEHSWRAPSGVLVTSPTPRPPFRWTEFPPTHVFWSYWQWVTKILRCWGVGPKRWLKDD